MADYGVPPYHETAAKAALRLLLSGAAGWGAVPGGANFGSAFLASGGRSAIAAQQANQAAERYALAQEETKRRAQEDAMQAKFMDAQIQQMSREKTPATPIKQQDYEHLISLGRTPDEARQIVYGATLQEQLNQKKSQDIATEASSGDKELSGPALHTAALLYLQTGQTPSMGMGKYGTINRIKVMEEAAKVDPNADLGLNSAERKANMASLNNAQKNYDNVVAFEETALANADVMLQQAERIPQTGTMWGNKISRYFAAHMGDPNVAAYSSALETVTPEFSRILSGGGNLGSSVLTDTQKRDIKAVLNHDYTLPQMKAAFRILKTDTYNRRNSFAKQIETIHKRLSSPGAGPARADSTGGADFIYNPSTGQLEPAR